MGDDHFMINCHVGITFLSLVFVYVFGKALMDEKTHEIIVYNIHRAVSKQVMPTPL